MENALAELLGYEDCCLQAIRYLIEVQHLDADNSIVVEILRLLTSKLKETTACSPDDRLGRSDPASSPLNLSHVEDAGQGRSSGRKDPSEIRGSSPKQQIGGEGVGLAASAFCPSPGLCGDSGGVTVTNTPVEIIDSNVCEDTGSHQDVCQKPALHQTDIKEYGHWLTGLAKRHPAIERLLLELTQLIDIEDGP